MLRSVAVSLALVALLLGDACPAQPLARHWSGPWDMIAFDVLSWGQPVKSWRLLADGSGSWTEEVAWNSGCMDEGYRAFIEILKAADTAVAAWGRAGRVLRTQGPDIASGTP